MFAFLIQIWLKSDKIDLRISKKKSIYIILDEIQTKHNFSDEYLLHISVQSSISFDLMASRPIKYVVNDPKFTKMV